MGSGTSRSPDEDAEDDSDPEGEIRSNEDMTESEGGEECARLTESVGGDGLSHAGDDDGESYCELHDLPPPPDGGYGWVIVFASFMCNMIVDGIAYTFGIFLTQLVQDFGEGKGKVAWVGSLLSGMYLTVGPIVSAFCNKYSCRAACLLGSVIASTAFVLSTFAPNSNWMMLSYGVMGGIGFGFIYLPSVVAVGYYFETKRSLATGIAVCGSGFGTFTFAPLATYMLEVFGWRGANLILAGLILNCAVFGALMRPLEYPKEETNLLHRMAEEKRMQMLRGSIGGSYFIVKLPDGSLEKRMKLPLNIDPGVHSSFNLDQLIPGTPINTAPAMGILPSIPEVKVPENSSDASSNSSSSAGSKEKVEKSKDDCNKIGTENKSVTDTVGGDNAEKVVNDNNKDEKEANSTKDVQVKTGKMDGEKSPDIRNAALPRNMSQPAFTNHVQGIPKNGSVPFFDRIRKTSAGERFKPPLNAGGKSVRTNATVNQQATAASPINGEVSKKILHLTKGANKADDGGSKLDVDVETGFASSKGSIRVRKERKEIVRPMSRKDIFYSGSVMNLPEFQSQNSLKGYRQSILSLSASRQMSRDRLPSENVDTDKESDTDSEECSCSFSESFKSVLASMLDVSLLKDPIFLMIAISNLFGMAAIYVPFVFLVDAAKLQGIPASSASFLISIIGITNTIGRVICGFIADFPWVDALFLNNICLLISSVAVAATPFCVEYNHFIIMAIFFGIAISGYISLTSIILVDLLGLDKLTNSFGLLILFRGAAAIIGSPLAGAVSDATNSYTVPFLMAGAFFFISACTSFMAPAMKRWSTVEAPTERGVYLAPIDEDDEEGAEDDDEDTGVNMRVPTIVEHSPSPAPDVKPRQEVNQIESVL